VWGLDTTRSGFIVGGYDRRRLYEKYGCHRHQLEWFIDNELFPDVEGKVDSYAWGGCGKYRYDTIESGWRPKTVERYAPEVEMWKAEYETDKKIRRKEYNEERKRQRREEKQAKPNLKLVS
jgi:hypothetical protein